jgi:SAM-dependent methyltransferase
MSKFFRPFYAIIGVSMKGTHTDILRQILQYSKKPALFEPGEARFWDDPHISKGMLEAHLNPDNDAASRKHKTIDKEVNHLISSGILKPGDRLLDLGCGPGLYASRFAIKGIKVTGIDFSERLLNYAIAQVKEKGLDINYRLMNFFDINYAAEFDAVLQTHGEMCTFPDEKRDELLAKLFRALKKDGLLIFDVTTRTQRMRDGLKNGWYISNGGFWRPGKHLVMEQGFDYPEHDVWLDQYIVIDDDRVAVYRNWFHDYDLKTIGRLLQRAGFHIEQTWNDLTGTPYQDGGEWIALVAKRG